jgi:dihydropteroate synthase
MIDLGGQSTRPGSVRVSEEEELRRVLAAVTAIHQRFPEILVSIDTFYSTVAAASVDTGACIVNDISAGTLDAKMISTVASLQVPYVLMHMPGTPLDMQDHIQDGDIVTTVLDFLIEKKIACHQAGINDVIIDPGFGFGKNIAQNFHLLKNLAVFRMLQSPILAGLSRKSTIYKTLGITAAEALNGTSVLNTLALEHGASILRVHDVKEASEAVKLWEMMK